jgi:uncharacterized membrane protein (DUF485 family)
MAGLDFKANAPKEKEDAAIIARTTRVGLVLFAVYVLLYSGFMGLCAFAPKLMATTPFGGANLAIMYGFGLIAAALVLALIYMWVCRTKAQTPPAADAEKGGAR